MNILEARHLRKEYSLDQRRLTVLNDISLSIAAGEFVVISGSSGSGKTTLLTLLSGLDQPTSGEYYLDGVDVKRLNDNALAEIHNRKIGFVFQTFNLLPRTTALQNVELPLIYRGLGGRERRRRVTESLEMVGLGDRMRHRPNELSGGQRQRVAIARALVNRPSIVLADEPTGNLDSRTGEEIMTVLGDLHRRGHTILLVTHEEYLAKHTQRIVRLRDGRIERDEVVDGPPQ